MNTPMGICFITSRAKGINVIDDDDNGIGDYRYNISLTPLIQDYYPIYDDGLEEYPLFINDTALAWNNCRCLNLYRRS